MLITVLIFAAMLAPRAYGEEIPDLIFRNVHIIGTGSQLDPGLIDEIRVATNSNYAAGSRKLQAQAAVMLGHRVTPGKSGRPKKGKELKSNSSRGR